MTSAPVVLDIRSPEIVALLGADLRLETLADGLTFTEGPVWKADEACLFFTDIVGDRILRWQAQAGVTVLRAPSHMANGLALDHSGRLIICEHATSRVTRLDGHGHVEVLAAQYDGMALNSPNDVIVARDGSLYFTDPLYGREAQWGVPRTAEMGFRGVYRINGASGALTLLADDFVAPNGLCLSADERLLFVNDSETGTIRRFPVASDGTLAAGVAWAKLEAVGPGSPDGMKLDRFGNLFCCGPGGIHVLAPDARCLGIIRMPEFAANLCFGGRALDELFITATTSLYRIRLETGG